MASEDVYAISQTLSQLENLWLTINQFIDEEEESPRSKNKTGKSQKARKRVRYTHTGRLLVVTQKWYQDELGGEGPDLPSPNRIPIGWFIQAGDWLKTFLETPNRQVAQLCQTLLHYDPYRRQWEKGIGIYLMFHGHMQCRGKGGVLTRSVGNIIKEVSLPIDTDHPIRPRTHFEDAMNTLVADKIIDGWAYSEETQLPKRQWLEHWLAWNVKIYIAPPQIKLEQGR